MLDALHVVTFVLNLARNLNLPYLNPPLNPPSLSLPYHNLPNLPGRVWIVVNPSLLFDMLDAPHAVLFVLPRNLSLFGSVRVVVNCSLLLNTLDALHVVVFLPNLSPKQVPLMLFPSCQVPVMLFLPHRVSRNVCDRMGKNALTMFLNPLHSWLRPPLLRRLFADNSSEAKTFRDNLQLLFTQLYFLDPQQANEARLTNLPQLRLRRLSGLLERLDRLLRDQNPYRHIFLRAKDALETHAGLDCLAWFSSTQPILPCPF
ncbi:hypothetical protein V8E54_007545 [Elaphomyces granulatus]